MEAETGNESELQTEEAEAESESESEAVEIPKWRDCRGAGFRKFSV